VQLLGEQERLRASMNGNNKRITVRCKPQRESR
jgi:hypothetical protein